MRCDECDHWLVEKLTTYEDGSVTVSYKAPDGKGRCDVFNQEFDADFFCKNFEGSGWDHREKKHKVGAPWQYWEMRACPDCGGRGSFVNGGACRRCVGTGKVRHYDDGYVGEEQTRLHPKEKERLAAGPPKCVGCGKDLELNWVSCPWCGVRTNKPSEPETVSFESGAQGTTDEMIRAARARREGASAGERA